MESTAPFNIHQYCILRKYVKEQLKNVEHLAVSPTGIISFTIGGSQSLPFLGEKGKPREGHMNAENKLITSNHSHF